MSTARSLLVVLAAALVLNGCIIIKDDRGLHRGHTKQIEKNKKK